MKFFSLSELGDPKIFQTEETKYVVVKAENSEDIDNAADEDVTVTVNDSDDIVYAADDDAVVTVNDSDDIIHFGSCEPEPGLYETNKELFYSLEKFIEYDLPSSNGVVAPEPFWIGEELTTENPLLDSGKIDILI